MPRISASAFPRGENLSVHTVATGMPFSSRMIESWIHHDVQEPQSPNALMTNVHSDRNA